MKRNKIKIDMRKLIGYEAKRDGMINNQRTCELLKITKLLPTDQLIYLDTNIDG